MVRVSASFDIDTSTKSADDIVPALESRHKTAPIDSRAPTTELEPDANSELPATEAELVRAPYFENGTCDDSCTLCASLYEPGDVLIYLPCGHRFHEYCLLQSLTLTHLCSVCQRQILKP